MRASNAAIAAGAPGSPAEHERLDGGVVRVDPVPDGARPGAPQRLATRTLAVGDEQRAERDQVGELADRLEVAERDEPLQPERVEPVAGEQREVGVGARHDARLAVMEQEALVDRLDEQLVLRRRRRSRGGRAAAIAAGERPAVAGGARRTAPRSGSPSAATSSARRSSVLIARPPPAPGARSIAANASAAAATVRSISAGPCASDGNHASNCDGGG